MVEAFLYASALGIVIPILAYRLVTSAIRESKRRRRAGDGQNGVAAVSGGSLLTLGSLLVACVGFYIIATNLSGEDDHGIFDPYDVLQISPSSNSTQVRAAYRSLSLMYHPDKNPGADAAELSKKFDRVARAYKTLTNAKARRNWELYGNPDGPQRWSYEIVIPKWIQPGKDASPESVSLYLAGYLVLIVSITFLAKHLLLGQGKEGQGEGGRRVAVPTEHDVREFLLKFSRTKSPQAIQILLSVGGSPQLLGSLQSESIASEASWEGDKEPTSAVDALKELEEKISSNDEAKEFLNRDESGCEVTDYEQRRNRLLILSHLRMGCGASSIDSIFEASHELKDMRNRILDLVEPLLDAALQIAGQSRVFPSMAAVIEAKALFRRAVWSHTDPDALNLQEKECRAADIAVPNVSAEIEELGTWGESMSLIGDKITASIVLKRDHAMKYQGLTGLSPDGSNIIAKGEPWWIILVKVQPQTGSLDLVGVQPCLAPLSKAEVKVDVSFQADQLGIATYRAFCKSPFFAGVDIQCSRDVTLKIYSPAELPDEEDGENDDSGDEEGDDR